MWQLIASNTVNDRRLPHSRHAAGLQPCMFGCSAGYILLTLSSLAIYFISLRLYTWQMRPGSAECPRLQKVSGSESASYATAVHSSLAILSVCHSSVWHCWCTAASRTTPWRNTSPRRRCLLLSDSLRLPTALSQTYIPEPGTDIRICIGFQNSKFTWLTKKSIITPLVLSGGRYLQTFTNMTS